MTVLSPLFLSSSTHTWEVFICSNIRPNTSGLIPIVFSLSIVAAGFLFCFMKQATLQALGSTVMGLNAKCRECRNSGGLKAVNDLEGHTDKLM